MLAIFHSILLVLTLVDFVELFNTAAECASLYLEIRGSLIAAYKTVCVDHERFFNNEGFNPDEQAIQIAWSLR